MPHKFRIFLFLFLISNVTVFGQATTYVPNTANDSLLSKESNNKQSKFDVGIESGVNFTLINGRSTWDNEVIKRNGITSGLNFQYNFKNKLSLQTAAYYTLRNYNSSHTQRKYGYLTIPLLVKAHFGKRRSLYVAGGFFSEMLLSEKIESNTPYYYYTESKMSKRPYLGAVAGIGFNFPLKENLSLSLDAKYWTGRTKDINKAGMTINTQSLLLSLKYSFGESESINHVSKRGISKIEKNDSSKKEKNKVHLKAFYASQVTYRQKTSDISSFYSSDLHGDSWTTFGYKSEIEIPTMGSEYGVLVEIEQSKHWNINIGTTIDNQGFVTKESTFYIYHDSRVGPVMSQHTVDTLENEKITYKYSFLTIPFIVNYQIKIKRTSFYIGLGLEPKLLLRSDISFSNGRYSGFLNGDGYSYDDDEKKLSEKLSGIVFCSSHIGISAPIGKKLFLFVEPDFKIALGHTDKISQLWSYGCRVGIKFGELKKHGSSDSTKRSVFFKPFYSVKNSYRKQLDDNTIIYVDPYYSYRYNSEEEIPKICSEAGLLFEIRLSDHFNINTGLTYEQRNFSTNKTNFTITSSSSWPASTRTINDELNYKFQFLSIPIFLNAETNIKKASVYLGTGIEIKRLLYSSIGFAHESSSIYSGVYKGDANSYYWDVHLGVALPLSKKLSLFIEPNLENGLNKLMLEGAKMDLQLGSYGCRVGLKF